MKRLIEILLFRTSDLWLVLRVFTLLGLVRLGLWLISFSKLRGFLVSIPEKFSFFYDCKKIDKLIWAINVSSRYMPGKVKCLARALTAEVLLQCNGYFPELRIGVMKEKEGKLEAHAWVENQGKVIIGKLQNLEQFKPLATQKEQKQNTSA